MVVSCLEVSRAIDCPGCWFCWQLLDWVWQVSPCLNHLGVGESDSLLLTVIIIFQAVRFEVFW